MLRLNYQKLILQRIDNVEKIQEKIQKDLADLIAGPARYGLDSLVRVLICTLD